MSNTKNRQVSWYRAWLPSIVWMVIILSISILPGSNIPSVKIPYFDKLVHIGIYLVLSILLLQGFHEQYHFQRVRFTGSLFTCGVAFLWGTLMELIQYQYTGSRHFEYLDILANIIGSLIGIGVFIMYLITKKSG